MSIEVIHIIDQLCREKGIEREILIEAIQSAVETAARKQLPELESELQSHFNEETGEVEIMTEKTVVTKVTDPMTEVSTKDAKKINPDAKKGETLLVRHDMANLGRIAAQLAKQVILQKVREAEIEIVYNDYQDKKGELINGIVQRFEHGDIIVELGKAEGILPRREQVFRETFNRGDRVRAFVLDIRKTTKNTLVILSRTHVGLIKRLFELEVPEISEGMVEIMGIVREPNGRTKIAVRTNDRDIDAVGACVGMRGMRVQSIVQELRGEKIDIVEYSEDPEIFIRNALSPAKISRIVANKDDRHMTIIVADDQMSLAIGKKGQNVRLAAKLVKWKIDIKNESESGGLLETPHLLRNTSGSKEDFLEIIKNTKGFGEKIVTILFNANIVTFDEVINQGVEGLVDLPGIGPKKAEALFAFSKEEISKRPEEAAPAPPPPAARPTEVKEDDSLVYTAPEIQQQAQHALAAAEAFESSDSEAVEEGELEEEEMESGETVSEETVEDEDDEYGLEELTGIDASVIESLSQSGFQTIAELSIATLDELNVLKNVDDETALNIIEQAKLLMEKYENV